MRPTDPLAVRHGMLLSAARRMARHHRRRERFLDGVHRASALLTAFCAAATAAAALAPIPPAAASLAALATLLSVCGNLLGWTRRARLHAGLARDWTAFGRDVGRAGTGPTEEALADLQARRLEIEEREPPPLRVLDAVCHDEVVTVAGLPDAQRSNVTPLQRLLCDAVDWRADRLRKRGDR